MSERMPNHWGARFVAIGDSFTEGVGDDLPDGTQRGWADLVALALAEADPSVQYANLAIRGKLLGPIIAEQLAPALALSPTLFSLCGGGNDVMRPRVEIDAIVELLDGAVQRAQAHGAHVLMLSGGNPSRHLPLGAVLQRRGDQLARACRDRFNRPGVTFVNNWLDAELSEPEYWSSDRLHLNAQGHTRVATNVLMALGVPVPAGWAAGSEADGAPPAAAPVAQRVRTAHFYRTHVLPWIGRRLTGRSSGDGRAAKRPALLPVKRP